MDICIDFDGTCVTHEFPEVGRDIGAVPILKRMVQNGHRLILFTMRSKNQQYGDVLQDAKLWFKRNEIPLFGIQRNPEQDNWTESPKAYGQMYIDDAALGTPLVVPKNGDRPYVDWERVEQILEEKGII